MDTSALTAAYADYLSLAEAGGFGEPEPGEWTAAEQIAHVALADASIAAVALAVASGQRPVYDNRASLDHWNLHRLIDEVGGGGSDPLDGLVERIRQTSRTVLSVASLLSDADALVPVRVLIISGHDLIVDDVWTTGDLVNGIARVHLPRHAEQLGRLRSV